MPLMPTTGTQTGSHQLSIDHQRQVRLTAHPLQRVGAYAMAALVKAERPSDVTPELFDRAVERMIDHAARAANAEKDDFFLKASRSFFPNSKMNHPSNGKRSAAENAGRIRGWRTMPEPSSWPGVPCSLCGRDAVAFYGKVDVPLVEAEIHRNTTPPGHEGLALCWPCVCCFYALPYGCRLSGGPSAALHSWDDRFLEDATSRRCEATSREIMVGVQKPFGRYENEYVAVLGLKQYVRSVTADVDLIVFGNDNRGASLSVYPMGQPLAEWLRRTVRDPALRAGRAELVRAYSFPPVSGGRRFAYDAFHRPERILDVMVDRLTGEPRSRSTGDDGGMPDRTRPAKAAVTRSGAGDTRPRSRSTKVSRPCAFPTPKR